MTARMFAGIALTALLGTLGAAQITRTSGAVVAIMGGGGQRPMMGSGAMPGIAGMQKTHAMTERALPTMMIPHHKSAIRMSQAIPNTTRDPQIKAWATAIVTDQQREITQMQGLLKGLGGPATGMNAGMMPMNGMMPPPARGPRTRTWPSCRT